MEKTFKDILEKYGLDERDKSYVKRILEKWDLIEPLGGKCTRCDEIDLRVLCFHHKSGRVGSNSWRHMSMTARHAEIRLAMESESKNIEVLCMNCHTREHSFHKLHDRFEEFFADILTLAQRTMKTGEELPVMGLPDGTMLLDWIQRRD